MYTNEKFTRLYEFAPLFSHDLRDLLESIRTFYESVELSGTQAYQTTVCGILDPFPVETEGEPDRDHFAADPVFRIGGRRENDPQKILEELRKYTEKFETVKYLAFLREEHKNVVFVGPNGCGKTSLLRKLKHDSDEKNILYFPSDRVMLCDENFAPKKHYKEFGKDLEDNYRQSTDSDNTSNCYAISHQFDYLLRFLELERAEEMEKHVENGRAEAVIRQWRELVGDRELFFDHSELHVRPIGGNEYPLKYLSSGEKELLYFLIGILLREERQYYFIDEPEMNLNPSIVVRLWNFLERQRPDSVFVYLTHDRGFVASRPEARIYWIKNFDGKNWDYSPLPENEELPQDLVVSLIGNRAPVLFCESHDDKKEDAKLFGLMFPRFKIETAEGWQGVRAKVKASRLVGFGPQIYGIIDCDYKSEEELKKFEENGVFHIPFHQVESFLCCGPIMRGMIETYSTAADQEEVFRKVCALAREYFLADKEVWITRHVAYELQKKYQFEGGVNSLNDFSELKSAFLAMRLDEEDLGSYREEYSAMYEKIVEENRYEGYLRYWDCKKIMKKFQPVLEFPKGVSYEQEVYSFLKSPRGETILQELRREYFPQIAEE